MLYRYSELSQPTSEVIDDDSSVTLYRYKETGDVVKVGFTDIFSHVNLSWDGTNFCLPSEEAEILVNETYMLLKPNSSQSIATSWQCKTRKST